MTDYKNQSEIQDDIISSIIRRDSTIATDVGQPLRRVIIDPIAENLEQCYIQDYRTRMSQQLDYLTGDALDYYLSNFGFFRVFATRSYGTLRLSRTTPSDNVYRIPYGVRFATMDGVYFRCTASGILNTGETYVDISAEAETPGEAGNVGANEIVLLVVGIAGITAVTNPDAFSGGTDDETDEEVRVRFRNEVLKNVAGTRDQYYSLPYEQTEVSKTTVISHCETLTEFVHFEEINSTPACTGAELSRGDVYIDSVYVEDIDRETFFTEHTDWELRDEIPETNERNYVEMITGGNLEAEISGSPYAWITYEYIPTMSRGAGCVEVYVTGENVVEAVDVFRYETGVNDYFFTKRPVEEIISVYNLTDGSSHAAAEYELISDTSNAMRSPSAADCLRWTPGPDIPDDGEYFEVTYSYNELMERIQDVFRDRKQVTANVLTHEGIPVYLDIYVKIMLGGYLDNPPKDSVDANIEDALTSFMAYLQYGSPIQFSDLEFIIHDIAGVDNVEVLQVVATVEEPFDSITEVDATHTEDFILDLNQYPVFNSFTSSLRSAATWSD